MGRMSSAHRDLGAEITEKQDLILLLTRTRERAEQERRDFEAKIAFMEQEIANTHLEAQRVTADLEKKKQSEEAKSMQRVFEEKTRQLEARLREMQAKARETERLRSLYTNDETKIKQLQEEVASTKRERVRLAKLMKERADMHKAWMTEQTKKVQELQRERERQKQEVRELRVALDREKVNARRRNEEKAMLEKKLQNLDMRNKRAESIRNGSAFAQSTDGESTSSTSQTTTSRRNTTRTPRSIQARSREATKMAKAAAVLAQKEALESRRNTSAVDNNSTSLSSSSSSSVSVSPQAISQLCAVSVREVDAAVQRFQLVRHIRTLMTELASVEAQDEVC